MFLIKDCFWLWQWSGRRGYHIWLSSYYEQGRERWVGTASKAIWIHFLLLKQKLSASTELTFISFTFLQAEIPFYTSYLRQLNSHSPCPLTNLHQMRSLSLLHTVVHLSTRLGKMEWGLIVLVALVVLMAWWPWCLLKMKHSAQPGWAHVVQ